MLQGAHSRRSDDFHDVQPVRRGLDNGGPFSGAASSMAGKTLVEIDLLAREISEIDDILRSIDEELADLSTCNQIGIGAHRTPRGVWRSYSWHTRAPRNSCWGIPSITPFVSLSAWLPCCSPSSRVELSGSSGPGTGLLAGGRFCCYYAATRPG